MEVKWLYQRNGSASVVSVVSPDEEKIAEELNCCICNELIYNCVTALPCLHNFCGHCMSSWMRNKSCPLCKAKLTKIRKNVPLNNILNAMRESDPTKKKTPQELEQIAKKDKFARVMEVDLTKRPSSNRNRRRDSWMDADEEDELEALLELLQAEDEEDLYLRCPECATHRAGDNFICAVSDPHNNCSSCKRKMPARGPPHQFKCELCSNLYCSKYFDDCRGGIKLISLKDYEPEARLSDTLFRGNEVDLEALKSFMAAKRISTVAIWAYITNEYIKKAGFPYQKTKFLYPGAYRRL